MPTVLEAAWIAFGSFVIPAIVGGLLHELTHAAVVVALGHDLEGMNLHRLLVGLRRGSTVIYTETHESRWNDLVGLSPLLVGLLVAAGWWASGRALVGPGGAALAVGWAFYALNLSREDLMGGDVDPAPHADKALEFAFIGGVGLVLQVVAYSPARYIGWALLLASAVGIGINGQKAGMFDSAAQSGS